MTDVDIRKGLAGVVADTTAISKVDPETDSLLYRGFPVQQLAEHCSFEEVAYLLWPVDDLLEQRAANALIRPLSAYTGPDERDVPRSGGAER